MYNYSIPLTPQDGVTPIHTLQHDAHKETEYDDENYDFADYVNKRRQECLLMLKVMNNMYH